MLSEGSSLDAQLQGSCCILVYMLLNSSEVLAVQSLSALLQHRRRLSITLLIALFICSCAHILMLMIMLILICSYANPFTEPTSFMVCCSITGLGVGYAVVPG